MSKNKKIWIEIISIMGVGTYAIRYGYSFDIGDLIASSMFLIILLLIRNATEE